MQLSAAWHALPAETVVSSITLSGIGGRPVYIFAGREGLISVDARTGERISSISIHDVLRSGADFASGVASEYRGLVEEDMWTRGHRLDPHRPLHRVQLDDANRTLLYVSSSTGEVVRDASLIERRLNLIGAWLHWLHAFRAAETVWRTIVIGLSILGTVLAISGTIVGVMQWKFRGEFRSGAKTPYREFYLHWHHVIGMVFAFVTITWIFSGLMSMNPFSVFASNAPPLDTAAYRGGTLEPAKFQLEAEEMLSALPDDFSVREIEWRLVGGRSLLVAHDADGEVRVQSALLGNPGSDGTLSEGAIVAAAGNLVPLGRMRGRARLEDYDRYYYGRASHTLFGNLERPLPVLKFTYDDPEETIVYADPRTGKILDHFDRADRRARWLFRMLHSWDIPGLLAVRLLWDLLMLVFLSGGLVLSVTGMVIGTRGLRASLRKS